MYDLFNKAYEPARGQIDFGRWRVLREMLQQMLDKAMAYYRINRTWINSRHPLVPLLESIDVPLKLDLRVYNDKVQDMALELGQIFKYTSPVSKGTMKNPSMFYGKGVTDAVLISIEDYDIEDFEDNWRDYSPIRILRHPRTDLGLWMLNGNMPSGDTGICVASINLPMLASQYRCWRLSEGTDFEGDPEAITTFLSRYPLTNALPSHYDVAFFNRLNAMSQGKVLAVPTVHTPFWQLDLSQRTDDILKGELTSIYNRRLTFDDILTQIPCITASCLGKLFKIPSEGIYTKQVIWLYALFRLPLVEFLVKENAKSANPRNTYYLKQMRRFFIATGNDRDILSMIPQEFRESVATEIRVGILPYLQTDPALFNVDI